MLDLTNKRKKFHETRSRLKIENNLISNDDGHDQRAECCT